MQHSSTLRSIALLAAACLLCGCSNFKSQRRLDLGPFAEQTIASVSTLNADLGQRRRILTLEYVKPLEDLDAEAVEHVAVLDGILERMIDYSVLVARLTRDDISEEERIELFAQYLEGFQDSIDQGEVVRTMSVDEHAGIIADVRAQETLLDAMRSAQPLISGAAQAAARTARALRGLATRYQEVIGSAIEADYEQALVFRRKTGEERDLLLSAFGRIYDYRRGDAGALEQVLTGPALPEQRRARFDPEAPDLDDALEDYLMGRYGRLMDVSDRLRPELEQYAALQHELDGILADFDSDLRSTWGVIFVWTRAHQRMASGVVDPAAWFDIKDAPSSIFRLAGKAL